ncbi:MAG TPA: hypothetical protein VK866_18965 [Acidimicrobiales bacterium]|nr:hypothetical protein [Acidimicrobiales bacterium]
MRRPSGWQWALLGVVALAIVGLGAALLLRSDDEPTSDPTAGTAGDVEQAQDEGSDPATDPETDATAPDAGEITDDATPVVSLPPVVVMVVRDGSRVVVLDTATGETRTLLEQPEADPDDPLPPNGFGRVILDPVADVVFVEEIGEPAAGVVRRVPLGGGEPDAVALGSYPALSPDGARLATADIGGGISILELDGGDRTELDGEPDASGLGAVNLAWGHDGRTLWFERITDVGGSSELWRVDALSASSLDDAVLVGPADDDQSWTLPAPRADGEVVVIEQCCTLTRPRGSANGVVIDATTGDVTSTFLLERGVFDAAYDSSGSFFLYVLVDGTVRWQGGGQGGQLATGASTADW